MSRINDVMEEERIRQEELEAEKGHKFMIIDGVPVSIKTIIADSKRKKRELAEG